MKRRNPPLRFLVVEDEMLIAMDIAGMVEEAGHVVVAEAACLREVGGLAADVRPDVAFVDLHLAEGSNGIDVCGLVQERWPETIVVFVTANPRKLADGHANAHGVIGKPFTQNGMMSTMRYLTEAICDPPPVASKPADFTEFPEFRAALAH